MQIGWLLLLVIEMTIKERAAKNDTIRICTNIKFRQTIPEKKRLTKILNSSLNCQKWREQHLEYIKQQAGFRYHPELHVSLPIAEVFNVLTKDKVFFQKLIATKVKIVDQFDDLFRWAHEIEFNPIVTKIKKAQKLLLEPLDQLASYNVEKLNIDEITKLLNEVLKLYGELEEKIESLPEQRINQILDNHKKRNPNSESPLSILRHCLLTTSYELRKFDRDFLKSITTTLYNNPELLISGVAGSGKTHLLCDFVEAQLDTGKYAVLAFAENFDKFSGTILQQIISQIGLSSEFKSETEFLETLNLCGEQSCLRT